MNEIEKFSGKPGEPLTMSSKDIAELTGKEHKNVCRDIRQMLGELHGEGGVLKFEHTQTNPQNGQTYPVFNLPKRETLILVSGYSVELRAKIIDRWQELEAKAANPFADMLPKNYCEAVQMLACTLKENEVLAEKTKEMEKDIKIFEPKALALDRIACADGSFNLTAAAKNLEMAPHKLTDWMRQHGWIYKRTGTTNWVSYQDKLTRGLLVHKTTTGIRPDGSEWISDQCRVTGKGLAQLSLLLNASAQPGCATT